MRIKTVNVRTLKDKLSSYLREVQRGEVILVTDRGVVVAELRRPVFHPAAQHALSDAEQRYVERGLLHVGLPNSKSAYRLNSRVRLPRGVIEDALDWIRGTR